MISKHFPGKLPKYSFFKVNTFRRHRVNTYFNFRTWFPYYNNKCWIKEILSTLYYYQSYLTCSRQNMVKSCDGLWTIKDEFIDMFEAKLKYKIEKYENQIKSAMENPGMKYIFIVIIMFLYNLNYYINISKEIL